MARQQTKQHEYSAPTTGHTSLDLDPISGRPHLVASTLDSRLQSQAADSVVGAELSRTPIADVDGLDQGLLRTRTDDSDTGIDVGGLPKALVKRTLDLVGAVFLGLLFLPMIAVIVVLIRRSGTSAVYRHRRVGLGGEMFECLKFTTMVPDAERVLQEVLERDPELKSEWLCNQKLRDDPRVTSVGRFLRRTSLDELPQLWNVIRGEMSLVGPRPVVREELIRYGRNMTEYLSAKPGITGLWQVSGRNDMDYRRRVAIDVYYVRNQGLLLDLYVLFKTIKVVLSGGGAY